MAIDLLAKQPADLLASPPVEDGPTDLLDTDHTIPQVPIDPPLTSSARNFMYGMEEEGSDVTDAALWAERKWGGGRAGWNTDEGFFYHDLADIYHPDWYSMSDEEKLSTQKQVIADDLNNRYSDVIASGGDETLAAGVGALAKELATPTTLVPLSSTYKLFKAGKGVEKVLKYGEMSAVAGLWGAELSVLDQLANEGTISEGRVLKEAALTAIITPAIPIAGRALVKSYKSMAGVVQRSGDLSNKQARRVYTQLVTDVQDGMGYTQKSTRIPDEITSIPQGEERAAAVQKWIGEKYRGVLEDTDTFLKKAGQEELPAVSQTTAMGTQAANLNGRVAGMASLPKEVVVSMDRRLDNISPMLGSRVKQQELATLKRVYDNEEVAFKASEAINSMKKVDPASNIPESRVLWDMLQDQQWDAVESSLYKRGYDDQLEAVREVRKLLVADGIEKEKRGIISKTIDNYFPRAVRDKKGLFADPSIPPKMRDSIHEALAKANKNQVAPLTEYQESQIINNVLSAPAGKGGIKADKSRVFTKIPEQLKQYYHTPEDALHIHLRQSADDIEVAKFFGKFNKKNKKGTTENIVKMDERGMIVEDSVGNLVATLDLDEASAREANSILTSIYGMGKVHSPKWISELKSWTYAGLLGNIRSTVTQSGDLAGSMQANGLYHTSVTILNRVGKSAMRKDKMISVLKDGGIANIGHEMAATGGSQKYLKAVMAGSGFRGMDMFGKNVLVESTLRKTWATARKNEGKIYDDMVPKWGLEDTKQLVDDFRLTAKTKEPTDLMKAYAFEHLAGWQPLTGSSLPQKYADHPSGRLLYTLNTWNIRMANQQHKKIVQEFNKGSKATAAKELLKFGLYFGTMDTGADYVKDMMNGRDVAIEDFPLRAAENLANMLFLDRYTREDFVKNPVTGLWDRTIAENPAIQFAASVYAGAAGLGAIGAEAVGVGEATEGDKAAAHKLSSYGPLAGPIIYNRTGGNVKANERFKKEKADNKLMKMGIGGN